MTVRLVIVACIASVSTFAFAGAASAGTLEVPSEYNTIQDAVDAADPGDVVLIRARPHPYKARVTVSTERLTIKGDPSPNGDLPVIDALTPNGDLSDPAFAVTANKFTASKLTITNGSGIDCDADECTVRDSRFRGKNQSDCVDIVGEKAVVRGTEFKGCDSHAVRLDGNRATIVGNKAKLSDSSCFDVEGRKLYFSGNKSVICEDGDGLELTDGRDSVIRNSITRGADNDGFELDGKSMLVENNRTRDMDDECMDIDGDQSVIRGNDSSSCAQGIELDGNGLRVIGNLIEFTGESDACLEVDGKRPLVKDNVAYSCKYKGMDVSGRNPVVVGNEIRRISEDDGLQVYCQGAAADSCREGLVAGNVIRRTGDDDQSLYISIEQGLRGFAVRNNSVNNGYQEGIQAFIDGGVIAGNRVSNVGAEEESAIDIVGDGNEIRGNAARENGGEGFEIGGSENVIIGNIATLNGIDGIRIDDCGRNSCDPPDIDDNVLRFNFAKLNRAEGIENEAVDTVIKGSVSFDNAKVDCANEGSIADKSDNFCGDGSNFNQEGKLDRRRR